MRNLLFFVLLCLTACGERKPNNYKYEIPVAVDTAITITNVPYQKSQELTLPDNIVITDKSLYPKEFIQQLMNNHSSDSIIYTSDYVVFNEDTIMFPDMLEIDKEYLFEGMSKGEYFGLKVKRKSICEIAYYCFAQDDEILDDIVTGEVSLSPYFFLTGEDYHDNVTGKVFSFYLYEDKESNEAYIGFSDDNPEELLAIINIFEGLVDMEEGVILRQVEKLKY